MNKRQFFNKDKTNKKQNKVKLETKVGIPYLILLFTLIILPMFFIVLYAFNNSKSQSPFDFIFSFSNFTNFFSSRLNLITLWESIYIAFISTLITLIIGYPFSYYLTKLRKNTQKLILLLITAPMWINMLIRTMAIKQIINMTIPSLMGTNTAIIFGMIYIYFPFMVLPIYTALLKIDDNLYEGASDLGANKFKTLTKVTIPLSLSGVISGILMVFLPTATALVVPEILGENKFMIGTLIEFNMLKQNEFGIGSATSLILIFVILLFTYSIRKADKFRGLDDEA